MAFTSLSPPINIYRLSLISRRFLKPPNSNSTTGASRILTTMNTDGWFNEVNDLWPGQCFSLKVKKVLHEETSKYQEIKLVET